MLFKSAHKVKIFFHQYPADAFQIKSSLPVKQDLLQHVDLLFPIKPISCVTDKGRLQKTDLIIIPQGSGTDSRHVRQFSDTVHFSALLICSDSVPPGRNFRAGYGRSRSGINDNN